MRDKILWDLEIENRSSYPSQKTRPSFIKQEEKNLSTNELHSIRPQNQSKEKVKNWMDIKTLTES